MKILCIHTLLITALVALGNCTAVSKMYAAACDKGMKSYNSSEELASMENTSVFYCAYKCQESPECRSIDYVEQEESSTCKLLNKKWKSACLTEKNVIHFVQEEKFCRQFMINATVYGGCVGTYTYANEKCGGYPIYVKSDGSSFRAIFRHIEIHRTDMRLYDATSR